MFARIYTNLNKFLKLSFKESALESRFQDEFKHDNLQQNKTAIAIALVAFIVYLPVSYVVTPDSFYNDLITIMVIPVPISIAYLFIIEKEFFKKNAFSLLFIYILAVNLPPIICFNITEYYQHVYVDNFIIPIIFAFVMLGVPFVISFISVSILLVLMALSLIVSEIGFVSMMHPLSIICMSFLLGAISGYLMEKSYRKNYMSKYELEDMNLKIIQEEQKSIKKEKIFQHKSRLAQMGEMIGMIAHQWRQPLNAISSSLILIKLKKDNCNLCACNDDIEECFKYIDKQHKMVDEYVEFLSTTIDNFRNFYKPDKDKELLTLTTPIKKTLQIVEMSMNMNDIEIDTDFENDDEILLYQNEMMQVILNILKNSEENFLEKEIKNPKIEINTKLEEGMYVIAICDNGGGIPENVMPYIFDPYFSTKGEKNGTGIGLYMSKIIIEEHHNGEFYAENIKEGVCFYIKIKAE